MEMPSNYLNLSQKQVETINSAVILVEILHRETLDIENETKLNILNDLKKKWAAKQEEHWDRTKKGELLTDVSMVS